MLPAFNFILKNVRSPGVLKRFAGHSKWKNIKHIKAAKDAEKASISAVIMRDIRRAVVVNGGVTDPSKNLELQSFINAATRANIPRDTLNNFLDRLKTSKEIVLEYQLRGPKDSLLLMTFSCIPAATSFTRENVGKILKHQSCLQRVNGFGHYFESRGIIVGKHPNITTMDEAEEAAILAGAEEVSLVEEEENTFQFGTEETTLGPVVKLLRDDNWEIVQSSIELLPKRYVSLSESEMEAVDQVVSKLKELPEFVKLAHNIA